MKVIKGYEADYEYNAPRSLNFERFADDCESFALLPGIAKWEAVRDFSELPIVYLEFEEPNRFCSPKPKFRRENLESAFHHVFSICPYTTRWLEDLGKAAKRTTIYFPFNEQLIPERQAEKLYDIIYTGWIHSEEISQAVLAMNPFKYRLISGGGTFPTHGMHLMKGGSYIDKIREISLSKITLVHNLLYLTNEHARAVRNTASFEKNKAFEVVAQGGFIVPQLKSRAFEAAFARSLILCRKDPWNIIENFFTPGKEFIYYEPEHLSNLISDILRNFWRYEEIVENAYVRAVNEYTTAKFVQQYLAKVAI